MANSDDAAADPPHPPHSRSVSPPQTPTKHNEELREDNDDNDNDDGTGGCSATAAVAGDLLGNGSVRLKELHQQQQQQQQPGEEEETEPRGVGGGVVSDGDDLVRFPPETEKDHYRYPQQQQEENTTTPAPTTDSSRRPTSSAAAAIIPARAAKPLTRCPTTLVHPGSRGGNSSSPPPPLPSQAPNNDESTVLESSSSSGGPLLRIPSKPPNTNTNGPIVTATILRDNDTPPNEPKTTIAASPFNNNNNEHPPPPPCVFGTVRTEPQPPNEVDNRSLRVPQHHSTVPADDDAAGADAGGGVEEEEEENGGDAIGSTSPPPPSMLDAASSSTPRLAAATDHPHGPSLTTTQGPPIPPPECAIGTADASNTSSSISGGTLHSNHLNPNASTSFYDSNHATTNNITNTNMLSFYEARMRDHAVAYASAAAGAAWAAAQVALAAHSAAVTAASMASPPNTGVYIPPPPPPLLFGNNPPPLNNNNPYCYYNSPAMDATANAHTPPNFPLLVSVPPSAVPSAALQPQQYYVAPTNPTRLEHPHFLASSPEIGSSLVWQPSDHHHLPMMHTPHYASSQSHFQSPAYHPYHNNSSYMQPATPFPVPQQQQLEHQQYRYSTFQSDPTNQYCQHPYPHHQQQQQHQQEDGDSCANQPRKRQQRLPPNSKDNKTRVTIDFPRTSTSSQPRDKIRRRLPSDNDSSSSGSSFLYRSRGHKTSVINKNKNHNIVGGHHPSSSHRPHCYNKKKKARPDESLLGKTGVAALFEWCSKNRRHQTPSLVIVKQESSSSDEFECIVFLDNKEALGCEMQDLSNVHGLNNTASRREEWGRGRGLNKIAAKQEAARQALSTLIPGVLFDNETGVLIALPDEHGRPSAASMASHMDDLAPNLAKQLAIGKDYSSARKTYGNSLAGTRPKMTLQAKRNPGTGIESSTTSEDDKNQSSYYATRGASVCSVLLHAIIQIDSSRLPEAPVFSYTVNSLVPITTYLRNDEPGCLSRADPLIEDINGTIVSSTSRAARTLRGSFTCAAKLKVVQLGKATHPIGERSSGSADDDFSTNNQSAYVLEASGVGGTKREARHVASAKLLALLFPGCSDMAEVKAAADAMCEQYAVSRVVKQQVGHSAIRRQNTCERSANITETHVVDALRQPDDPPLPNSIRSLLQSVIAMLPECVKESEEELISSVNAVALTERKISSSPFIFQQLGRQNQIDSLVESALTTLNENDEEGRSVSSKLSHDDVGRTVLRRAYPDDLPSIKNLFMNQGRRTSCPYSNRLVNDNDPHSVISWLRSSSSPPPCVVLLLCRAIAAYEDPPLGCAVLSIGFSMENGRHIRLDEISSEPHLPKERFVECLQDFASCMKCTLCTDAMDSPKTNSLKRNAMSLLSIDFEGIIKSHIDQTSFSVPVERNGTVEVFQKGVVPLHSVKEESEDSDESSGADRRTSMSKQHEGIKRSKRSRFE